MARAALSWSTTDLATRADVGANTVNRFEAGQDARISSVEKMRNALEAAGVIFVPENGEGPGVRLRKGVTAFAPPLPSAEAIQAGADHALRKATKSIDRALDEIDATGQQKMQRREALTDEPEVVKKARRQTRRIS